MLAFHEAFADIVALFQHFSIPEALIEEVRKRHGGLGTDTLLAKLAMQFGQATSGDRKPLRDALGKPATRTDYESSTEPHERGGVLVAAVFAAFVSIYQARAADLVRLATQGTGVLAPGDIPDDLVKRLTLEASKAARHVLSICIRALDYCPPIDITFGEYLRALITADYDAVPNDVHGYRVALFPPFATAAYFHPASRISQSIAFCGSRPSCPKMTSRNSCGFSISAGISTSGVPTPSRRQRRTLGNFTTGWWTPSAVSLSLRSAFGLPNSMTRSRESKAKPGGLRCIPYVPLAELGRTVAPSPTSSSKTQSFHPANDPQRRFRGGCTLLIDAQTFKPRYLIRKRLDGSTGLAKQMAFRVALAGDATLRSNFYSGSPGDREPFALLHGRH